MSLYLSTTDAEVLATIERNQAGFAGWRSRAFAYAAERGADSFWPSSFAGRHGVAALPLKPEGFGRWTKPDHRGRSHPFSNNTAEQALLKNLAWTAEPVPGVPGAVHSVSDSDGRSYLMWPAPFIYDGAAWLGYSHLPEPDDRAKIGEQWTEVLASSWHAALEGENARRAAASS